MKRIGFAMVVALVLSVLEVAGEEPLYLVRDGKPQAVIVQAEPAVGASSRYVGRAVGDLRSYVKQITSADLRVVASGTEVAGPAIHVGRTDYVQGLGLNLDAMDREGIVIRRVGDRLVLVGGGPLGTLNAVRIFLEGVCGVRWYIPGDLWRIVPKQESIAVDKLDRVHNPHYINRDSTGMVFENWMRWNRANYPSRCWIGHNIGKIVDPKTYGETHPEYFPKIGGERSVPRGNGKSLYHSWQPCLSNPDVVKICVAAARQYFDARPESEVFSLAQNDNYGWCRCDACMEMNGGVKYDEKGHMCFSDLYFRFLGKVCDELAETHPAKLIGTMAYMCGTYDPPSFKAHPNIVVLIANDRSRFHFSAEFRRQETAFTRSWAAKVNHIAFHNWHFGSRYLIPRLELKSTRDFLRFGHEIGAMSYHGEEYPNWGLEGPKTWITFKLLWNVNEDLDALLQDFCDNCFERAAAPMRRFYDTLEDAWNNQPILDVPVNAIYLWREDRRQLDIVTPGTVRRCCACLDEALALANNDTVRQRIEHVRKTFRMVEYFTLREAVYNGLDAEQHLTPPTFLELVDNLNRLEFATYALRSYIRTHIRDDLLTYARGWPGLVPMNVYYCELGSRIAAALAREEVADAAPESQADLTASLNARFEMLGKEVVGAGEVRQGPAWQPFSERLQNYLLATAYVPRLKPAPAVDGRVLPAEWQQTPVLTGFYVLGRKASLPDKAEYQTQVRLGYDDNALYVAYTLAEADLGALADRHDKHDSGVWQDDCADFAILPAGTGKEDFLHYIVNPRGVCYDAKGAGGGSSLWKSGFTVKTGREPDANRWTLEMAIPWSDFGRRPTSGEVWRAQFGRNDVTGIHYQGSCWAPTSEGLNNADYLGVLLFE